MSSTTNTGSGVTFPSTCNRARPYLLLSSLYAIGGGTLLIARPSLLFNLPLLGPIERLTGLAHIATPITLEARRQVATTGLIIAAMGLVYGMEAGPWWEHGGKAFAQISIDGRLIFAAASFAVSFLTPYGSSLLVGIAAMDAVIALFTQKMVGAREELIGRPISSELKKPKDESET